MFVLHNSNRIEILAERLSEVMGSYQVPPLCPRTVVVNNPGMGRWLSFELARADSICANMRFPLPAAFIGQLLERLLPDRQPAAPFDRDQLAWLLIKAIPGWLAETSAFLPGRLQKLRDNGKHDPQAGKYLYHLAQRLAELYDSYLVYRPDMVLSWEGGRDAGEKMREKDLWQASLWRYAARTFRGSHRASVLVKLKKRLAEPVSGELEAAPISLFGLSHLPPAYLEIFFQLARHVDIHLFLLNPCRTFWEDARTPKKKKELDCRYGKGAAESFHPLLESQGVVGRDFLHSVYQNLFDSGVESDTRDYFHVPEGNSLLARLQKGILEGVQDNAPPFRVEKEDFSIQIHSCHSRLREVEVLHDQLLDLFSTIPGLEPHEVLVMTPDIRDYAPFIEAVFDAAAADRSRFIPWSLADLSESSSNPLIGSFLKLMEMSDLAVTAPALMDILESPYTARRFRIDEEKLEVIRDFTAQSGIRRELGFDDNRQNSWRFGLDRLLGSYCFSGDGTLNGVLPFELPVEGENARAAGSLALFVSRINRFRKEISSPRSPSGWQEFITGLAGQFFLPETTDEQQGMAAIMDAAARLARLGETAGITSLDWSIVREFLKHRFSLPSPSRRFISGRVTFSSLVPMRSIPARVICLLGMNDSDFPRRRPPLNFDLIAGNPRQGDKFPRDEDRYLFLETLLSARNCLYISYVGRSQKDNSPKVPSGVVNELLDFLEGSTMYPGGRPGAGPSVAEHPLMPFSAVYSARQHPRLFTYAAEWCRKQGSRDPAREPETTRPFFSGPIQAEEETERVSLDTLTYFFSGPQKFFLSRCLKIDIEIKDAILEGDEPFDLTGLENYMYIRDLIRDVLEDGNAVVPRYFRRLKGQGRLPFPPFDQGAISAMETEMQKILPALIETGISRQPLHVDLEIRESGIREVHGQIWTCGKNGAVTFRPATIKAADRLSLWIRHLAATLASEKEVAESIHVGSEGKAFRLGPVSRDNAERFLADLLDIYAEGLKRPVPLLPEASFEFLKKFRSLKKKNEKQGQTGTKWEKDALSAALTYAKNKFNKGQFWNGGYSADRWTELAFRGRDIFDDEFAKTAFYVFGPVMDHEGGSRV